MIGEEVCDRDNVHQHWTFEPVFGRHANDPLSYDVLEGLLMQFDSLPHCRKSEHERWVAEIMRFPPMMPGGCRGVTDRNGLKQAWFHGESVPGTQVHVDGSPDMQELETVNVLLTLFGVPLQGNCGILALGILAEDSNANHGETTMAR
ncbi:unnamed protein product [Prorocentrum cordatum]|uniref:Uncharacterized protein n=1 Tax=Prorocentrum cordatum TaxID=2364126 RepID=A0ABN9U6V0_9DINO|nr:unnamed protein product [Polarella glacialis]